MKQIEILIAMVFVLGTMSCGSGNRPPAADAIEVDLQRLESAKWHPSSLGNEKFSALFADDFVTVEYGANLHGGVERKFNATTSMSGPESAGFFKFLDETHFELSDWRFIHIDSVGVVASYHVSAPTLRWSAYATSVWAKRGDRWLTVFYQASTAR